MEENLLPGYKLHSRRSSVFAISLVLALGVCLLLAVWPSSGAWAETPVTVTYSFPMISEHEAPGDRTLEGSITVTMTSDAPIKAVGDPPWLTQISNQSFRALFLWNDTTPRPLQFTDASYDTTDVVLLPTTNYPLDLANHQGPVFHIQTDPQNLWDQDTGIYVWGNHNNHQQTGAIWERPATVDYYDETGALVFTEPIGLRINGQSSRNYHQKGLRLYFDDYGLYDTVNCDFFGDGPTIFERLILRGNRYPDFAISSALNEPLHQDLGHKGSRHRYVAVYLNNELWGAYSLRERLDDEFVEKTWQWADDDEFILIKDHEAEVGDYTQWESFLSDFSGEGPFDTHQWYEEISSQIDLVAYIDWLMINICGASSDNMGGKNLAILKIGNGPWEFMTWDEDILYQSANLNANHFRFYSAGTGPEFLEFQPPVWFSGGPWSFTFQWNNMLRALMQNAQFKSLLRHRGAELLDGALSVQQSLARLDSVAVHQEPEWVNHGLRWNHSPLWYTYKRGLVETFISNRHPIVSTHLDEFLELWAQPVELVSFTLTEQETNSILQWSTEREEDCSGFVIQCSVGSDSAFETISSWRDNPDLLAVGGVGVVSHYAFTAPNLPLGEHRWYRICWESGAQVVTPLPWVESTLPAPAFSLRLNEFMAVNDGTISDEYGQYDDWLEIYNPTEETISTAGLFLSDDLAVSTKWALPDTSLEAYGYLLFWCDGDVLQGPLHTGFKISGSGEELGLYSCLSSGNLAIDTVIFGVQQADVSSARLPDGSGPWLSCSGPTPGISNTGVTLAPLGPSSLLVAANAWPNPFNPSTSISFELAAASPVKLQIFDMRGSLVDTLCDQVHGPGFYNKTWQGCDSAGQKMASGLYFAMITVPDQKKTLKLVLLN